MAALVISPSNRSAHFCRFVAPDWKPRADVDQLPSDVTALTPAGKRAPPAMRVAR